MTLKRLSMFRKFLAVILIIIFIPIFQVGIFSFVLNQTFLNNNYYITEFNKNNFYQKFFEGILPILTKNLGLANLNINTQNLAKNIDPIWLKTQSEKIINGFFDYFSGKNQNPEIVINLQKFKENILPQILSQISEQIKNLPTCTPEELKNLENSNEKNLNCLPPGISQDQIDQSFSGQNNNLAIEIPNEINIGQMFIGDKNQKEKKELEKVKQIYGINHQVPVYFGIVSIIILLLIALLVARPKDKVIKWLSVGIFIPSLILLIFSLGGYYSGSILGIIFCQTGLCSYTNLADLLTKTLIQSFLRQLIIISAIFFAVSVVGLIVSHILKPKSNNNKTI